MTLWGQTNPIPGGCVLVGQNLIVNPEFDQGNVGINSSYLYHPELVCDWGQYTVAKTVAYDPAENCYGNGAFDIRTIWAATDRENPGLGNFMIIDPCRPATGGSACSALDDKNVLWTQTVSVCPNTDYVLSLFAKNLYYLDGPQYNGANIEPRFDLFVNGELVNNYHLNGVALPDTISMPQSAKADSAVWRQISGTWTSDVGETVAVLEIRNTQTSSGGNDLGLDGIYFGLCGRDASMDQSGSVFQCQSSGTVAPVTLTATSNTQISSWGYYEWYKDSTVVMADKLLTTSDTIPNLVTPMDPNTNDYFGAYRLVVYADTTPTGSCGNGSGIFSILDSCATTFPVEWLSLQAVPSEGGAMLSWATGQEIQNQGFVVEMSHEGRPFEPIGWVEGNGNSQDIQTYTFQTEALMQGRYTFQVQQVDYDGQVSYSPRVEMLLTGSQDVIQLSPNPARDHTWLTLSIDIDQPVAVDLFSTTGRHIRTLHQGTVRANSPTVLPLTISDLSGGVYIIRIRGAYFSEQRRLLVE